MLAAEPYGFLTAAYGCLEEARGAPARVRGVPVLSGWELGDVPDVAGGGRP
jgi:hypothetical protein